MPTSSNVPITSTFAQEFEGAAAAGAMLNAAASARAITVIRCTEASLFNTVTSGRLARKIARTCGLYGPCGSIVNIFSTRDDTVHIFIDESGSARKLRQLAHERSRPMGNNVPAVS